MFDNFVGLPRDGEYRFLDFGCGEGYSIEALLDMFPRATFVGVDYDAGTLSRCREAIASSPRVTLIHAPDRNALAAIGSDFDVIQLNAVVEHLLPAERKDLMSFIWQKLRPGGYLVVTETPWRWFPIETHTTSLPFVNYLNDHWALAAMRHFNRHGHPKDISLDAALRQGLRGATVREIIQCLGAPADSIRLVRSANADARDLLEVWWHGECRQTPVKRAAYRTLSAWRSMTGMVISPWVNIVLQKVSETPSL
jgi:SAM-dependent methyltransferase